jgi:hypothetical protein
MNTRALEILLRRRPFEPFALELSSSTRYPIVHPEHCLLDKDCAVVAFRTSKNRRPSASYALISYLHIGAAEPFQDGSKAK